MQELVNFIATSLVDRPEEVKVAVSEEDDCVTVDLTVAPEDLGKVIGKQGRTARAMRSVLAAASARVNKRSRLEIVE